MSDLEGLARQLVNKNLNKDIILSKLVEEYLIYKDLSKSQALELAKAVFEEIENSYIKTQDKIIKQILEYPKSHVTMGLQGVGCRGWGDFFIHNIIAKLSITSKKAYLAPTSLDDAGAVIFDPNNNESKSDKYYISSKMEGMHSRLSDFPFIAGFHVTRAALRDLFVKGSEPISILIDIHLADDADIGKLFDFMGGVSAVAELSDVPITGGSTLRIGGDLVIGNRIVGGIAAVGITQQLKARRNISNNDVILMTEGAGGGTIATTAIYGGFHDVVKETMNLKFLKASRAILDNKLLNSINSMCDVTNGGIRGDLNEIAQEAKVGMIINEDRFKALINKRVLEMLNKLKVDYLGVSLDALLIFCPESKKEKIVEIINSAGVKVDVIGRTNNNNEINIMTKDGKKGLLTRYRESAYTKVKQVVGETIDENTKKILAKKIEKTAEKSIEKRDSIIKWIRLNQ